MKEFKMYQCEICGTQFKDKRKAEKCEQSHRKIIKAIAAKYAPYPSSTDGRPEEIMVSFNDGSEAKYKIQHNIYEKL